MLDYDFTKAVEQRQLQLSKLEESRAEVCKSARSYKAKAKLFHNRHIIRKEIAPGMKALLYDSKLHLF